MMSFSSTTSFTLVEWLSLTGFFQCSLILVYILFRVRNWGQAATAFAYFLCLSAGFALQFATRLEDFSDLIRLTDWFFWALGAPLGYLLILQVARLSDRPDFKQFWVLGLVPVALLLVLGIRSNTGLCAPDTPYCDHFFEMTHLFGMLAGLVAMLALWWHKGLFASLLAAKGGKERYWLVLSLIVVNILMFTVSLLLATSSLELAESDFLRVVFGIAFVYLASTTLFRVYPLPVQLAAHPGDKTLNEDEKKIAAHIKELMTLDKLYHDPLFSRASLARELQVSENTLSRIINSAFGKSFPQLLSEYRIEDAKRMLANQNIPVKTVAFEVGFNSLPSFNRVFREIVGQSPSDWRNEQCTLTQKI